LAIAFAAAAALSPLLPRAAKVDISRFNFDPRQCGHCTPSSPGRTNASNELSHLVHRYS
jgi:hypothetical protein